MDRFRQIMIRFFFLLLVLSIWIPATTVFSLETPTDLFISEYIEGSSNNKAIEIFNGTGAPIDLAANSYNVQMFFNGSATAGLTINLTGTVLADDVFVLAQASANATILAQADQTNSAGWFNGDDAVVLRKGTVVIDSIGQAGFDPGTEWGTGITSTADNTLVRKADICTGDTNATDVFDPALQWDGFATDTFTGLGTYSGDCGTPLLLFSEYIEGSSNNKALEIYNGSDAPVNLATGGYNVQMFFNGSATAGLTINLTGTVANGDVYVIAQSSANAAILAQADQTNGAGWFNGDDAVVLRKGTIILDSIGQVGSDPGTEWGTGLTSTMDNTLVRKATVCEGDTNTSDAFDPAQEWDGFATDTFGNLGSHTIDLDNCGDEPPPPPEPELAFIHEVQGTGASVVNPGLAVIIEAVVTANYSAANQLDGFYIQEEAADADANPQSSEGIFVYCGSDNCHSFDAVSVGNLVSVTGVQEEAFGQSQINIAAGELEIVSPDNLLPPPASIALPVVGDIAAFYEPFEGMLVHFVDDLTVSEYFNLFRFGEVVLYQGGRPFQYTHFGNPADTGAFNAYQTQLANRRIILDDDNNSQNSSLPHGVLYYPQPEGFAVDTPIPSPGDDFRGGDTVTNLTGILSFGFSTYRVLPVDYAYTVFTPTNPRPDAPISSGSLTVASFNVLNYFLTIDTPPTNSGPCGPNQNQDCRGADSVAELEQQTNKLVTALLDLNADIYGLIEMENTPDVEPLAYLVSQMNAVAGTGTYAYVDTGVTGTDAIRVGIIYKTMTVTPVGNHAVLDTQAFVNPRNAAIDRNRPALAQSFRENATGAVFTVVVNHLKSKGSGCGAGDDSAIQGNCNRTRTLAAQVLVDWLTTDPTGVFDSDYLLIGDYNSYANEDPITTMEAGGFIDLNETLGGGHAYSYVFDGQLGYLDYALASDTLEEQVADIAEWHINADEVPIFDYNDDVRDPGEADFEEEPDGNVLTQDGPYRTSDHDPVFVGLNLIAPTLSAGGSYTVNEGSPILLTASAQNFNGTVNYSWDLDNNGSFETVGNPVSTTPDDGPAILTVAVQACDVLLYCQTSTATITGNNVAPTLVAINVLPDSPELNGAAPLFQGETASIFITAADPSVADTAALAFDVDCDAQTEYMTQLPLFCTVPLVSEWIVTASVQDKDGASDSETSEPRTVLNTHDTINFVIQIVQTTPGLNNGQKNALVSKLHAIQQQLAQGSDNAALGQLTAFINQVLDLQATGVLSADDADVLIRLANRLSESISNS